MSEVFAPRYLAGLVSTHGYLRSRHLCQTPLNGVEAYPVRTWLTSWNCAIQIQKCWFKGSFKRSPGEQPGPTANGRLPEWCGSWAPCA